MPTVKQLKDELKKRGLSINGLKAALEARLAKAEADNKRLADLAKAERPTPPPTPKGREPVCTPSSPALSTPKKGTQTGQTTPEVAIDIPLTPVGKIVEVVQNTVLAAHSPQTELLEHGRSIHRSSLAIILNVFGFGLFSYVLYDDNQPIHFWVFLVLTGLPSWVLELCCTDGQSNIRSRQARQLLLLIATFSTVCYILYRFFWTDLVSKTPGTLPSTDSFTQSLLEIFKVYVPFALTGLNLNTGHSLLGRDLPNQYCMLAWVVVYVSSLQTVTHVIPILFCFIPMFLVPTWCPGGWGLLEWTIICVYFMHTILHLRGKAKSTHMANGFCLIIVTTGPFVWTATQTPNKSLAPFELNLANAAVIFGTMFVRMLVMASLFKAVDENIWKLVMGPVRSMLFVWAWLSSIPCVITTVQQTPLMSPTAFKVANPVQRQSSALPILAKQLLTDNGHLFLMYSLLCLMVKMFCILRPKGKEEEEEDQKVQIPNWETVKNTANTEPKEYKSKLCGLTIMCFVVYYGSWLFPSFVKKLPLDSFMFLPMLAMVLTVVIGTITN